MCLAEEVNIWLAHLESKKESKKERDARFRCNVNM